MTQYKLRTIIFIIRGLATRLYPYTKTIPKQLVLINNKALIEHAIIEAQKAGFTRMIFEYRNDMIKQYIKNLKSYNQIEFIFIKYKKDYRPGKSLIESEKLIKDEYFLVSYPDDFFLPEDTSLIEMKKEFLKNPGIYCLLTKVGSNKNLWGMAECQNTSNKRVKKVLSIIEKPKQLASKFNYGIIARYLFHSSIFETARKFKLGQNENLELPDVIRATYQDKQIKQNFYGFVTSSLVIDCGVFQGVSLASFLSTNDFSKSYYLQDTKKRKQFQKNLNKFKKQLNKIVCPKK
ncbi:MAG: sugar phosphate nucleotidyltransferase [Candidatus Parcubacteria bacterium]|nr:sugar phosphate nucleotidyltransferase [Candidatus Parcubacteria bacterium]